MFTLSARKKKSLTQGLFEFIKLQIAGNIPFWGTYLLFALLDKVFHVGDFQALLVATVAAYMVFFIVDDRWVFNKSRNNRKTTTEIWRFVVFMSLTALLTFNITWQLNELFGITPYIGQFISAGLSISWTFIGLKFWVFAPGKRRSKR
jgi:putative flippase GtrA